jgi:PhnB protein
MIRAVNPLEPSEDLMPKAVPEGLHTITPALTIDGAAKAIEFYQRAFGATEVMRAPDPSGQKIWHAAVQIGDSQIFVNDTFPEMGATARPSRLWIYLEGVDAAFKRAVDAGASVKMPPADMFWGDRLATVEDPFGNQWTIAQHVKDLTPAEMEKAQAEAIAQFKKK